MNGAKMGWWENGRRIVRQNHQNIRRMVREWCENDVRMVGEWLVIGRGMVKES